MRSRNISSLKISLFVISLGSSINFSHPMFLTKPHHNSQNIDSFEGHLKKFKYEPTKLCNLTKSLQNYLVGRLNSIVLYQNRTYILSEKNLVMYLNYFSYFFLLSSLPLPPLTTDVHILRPNVTVVLQGYCLSKPAAKPAPAPLALAAASPSPLLLLDDDCCLCEVLLDLIELVINLILGKRILMTCDRGCDDCASCSCCD